MSTIQGLLEKFVMGSIILSVGFFIGCVFVEIRVEKVRRAINEEAMHLGIVKGTEIYKAEYLKGEHLMFAKRKARDEALIKYVNAMTGILRKTHE